MSYNSKYTGQQVESLLDQVASGNAGGGGGGITVETDPIFSASAAAKITEENISSWNNKVDKVDGKQLSTEDFTTLLKQKLEGLANYDDTSISQAVQSLQTQLNTLVSGNASTAVESFNEIIAFLNGIEDSDSLDSIIASIEQQIAGKADKSNIPTKVSQLKNDAEYAVPIHAESQSLSFGVSLRFPFAGSDLELNTTQQQRYEDTELELSYNKYGGITENTVVGAYVTYYKIGGATSEKAGFMTKEDKIKLDGIDMASKQDTLVSGISIKTVNGTSILGSGNITISGGITTPLYPLRVHSMDDDNVSINPGEYHMWPMPMTALTITLAGRSGLYCAHWIFRFSSESTPTTLSLPNLQWANGNEISISPNKTYEVSITDGLAVWVEF